MRNRRSIVANPVLVGAVTTLVVIVAVFLAYNANNGLPFVPTTALKVRVPNAYKLVPGNEVREGGYRIGVVDKITAVRGPRGGSQAELDLKLDKSAAPLPDDTTVVIRPRSALGLKYVEVTRGSSRHYLPDGATITVGQNALPVEIEDFFNMFDERTRSDARTNLFEFGDALAGRGDDLNRALAALPQLLTSLEPVARSLADPRTELTRFFEQLDRAAAATAPVAGDLAQGFASGADTFEALSRYPQALRQTIAKSPATLDVGTRSLHDQRPFLHDLAKVSDDLRGAAHELRASLPAVNVALKAGTPVLRRTPVLNDNLQTVFAALRDLTQDPTTNAALRGLTATATSLNPTLRYLGPYVSVCNYWNTFWTFLADHFGDQDPTGETERIQTKMVGPQDNSPSSFGAAFPANGDQAFLHNQPYGAAINPDGSADCETGQRGYPRRLADGAPARFDIAVDPHTPGSQGTTFTGRGSVPQGETFSRDPQIPLLTGAGR